MICSLLHFKKPSQPCTLLIIWVAFSIDQAFPEKTPSIHKFRKAVLKFKIQHLILLFSYIKGLLQCRIAFKSIKIIPLGAIQHVLCWRCPSFKHAYKFIWKKVWNHVANLRFVAMKCHYTLLLIQHHYSCV